MRTKIVYRNKDGQVEKETIVVGNVMRGDGLAHDFHANVNRTYYELEQQGKLNDMSVREKVWTRDLHIAAQDPRYWGPQGE